MRDEARRRIEERRGALAELCVRRNVLRLLLFGSALREDFEPGRSDLDFLVEFRPMTPREHKDAYFGLLADLAALFGCRVDLVEPAVVRNPYLRRSIEDGQEVLYAAA